MTMAKGVTCTMGILEVKERWKGTETSKQYWWKSFLTLTTDIKPQIHEDQKSTTNNNLHIGKSYSNCRKSKTKGKKC